MNAPKEYLISGAQLRELLDPKSMDKESRPAVKHKHNWARTVAGVRCSICGAYKVKK